MTLNAGFLMPINYVPPEHHVMRYASWAKLRKDEDDNVVGVLGTAFKLRPTESYLSATWIEFFGGNTEQSKHRAVLAIRASEVDVKPKGGFAVGNLEKIIDIMRQYGRKIRIIHEPAEDNEAHCALRNWPSGDDNIDLFELIAEDAWSELVLNADVR